ncbi:MAG: tetratricopeptide repeat protein [Candidatus Sumerlaeota bacterium]|nr:tetratricopeptide repeat protein [Candidatus Sumerlaeota bacterium]
MPESSFESKLRPIRTEGGEALYRQTLEKFQTRLKDNSNKALRQYGMTFFHSLPVDQRVRLGETLNFSPDNAITHYDLGVVAAGEGNWAKAIPEFQTALKKDETLHAAQYNLALALEKNGDRSKAKQTFERLLEAVKEDENWAEDSAKIKAHIAELG